MHCDALRTEWRILGARKRQQFGSSSDLEAIARSTERHVVPVAYVRSWRIPLKKSALLAVQSPDSLLLIGGGFGDDGRADGDAGGAVL
jgi:hypothetical protein